MRRIKLSVAASLDGFIAGPNGDLKWLFDDQDYGLSEFYGTVDTVLLGRKTYDGMVQMGMPSYPHMRNFVFSATKEPGARDGVEYVRENPATFCARLRQESGKDIWLVGGGTLAHTLIDAKLLDEIGVAVHPVMLGGGVPLFRTPYGQLDLELAECKPYDTGLVALSYRVKPAA